MFQPVDFDCIVVGAGPTGAAAALALARSDFRVALISDQPAGASRDASSDTRTAALFPGAIAMLAHLGVWESLRPSCEPLAGVRIVDATGRLLRAPEVVFKASDLGIPDLGWNIANAALIEALTDAVEASNISLYAGVRATTRPGTQHATVELSDARALSSRLVVAADGRRSQSRDAAGIRVREWAYEQSALATRFHHSRSHYGISTELHGPDGPCTTVPFGAGASSLVWMDRPALIDRLAAMPPDDFLRQLSERLCGLLGSISQPGPRRVFPLSGLAADSMGRERVALVGEAAHAMPPIGAQGLNLGLTDVAVLVDLLVARRAAGGDIGSAETLAAYHNAREGDVRRRTNAVDLLNRSVQPVFWPLGLARGAGMHVLAAAPSLRRRLMREGLYPPAPTPRLMRSDAIVDRLAPPIDA